MFLKKSRHKIQKTIISSKNYATIARSTPKNIWRLIGLSLVSRMSVDYLRECVMVSNLVFYYLVKNN